MKKRKSNTPFQVVLKMGIVAVLTIAIAITSLFTYTDVVEASTNNCLIKSPRVTNADSTFNINSTWDLVTFGNYPVKNGGAKKPIVWRVLSTDGKTALLLSEYTISEPIKYNETCTNVTWQNCTLRQFLNGLGSTYASNNYLYNAFSQTERNLMLEIEGNKVTLPTLTDVVNPKYGFCSYVDTGGRRYLASSTRMAMTSEKGDAGAALGENDVNWWLRYYTFKGEECESKYKDHVVGGEVWTMNSNAYVDNSGTKCYVRPMIRVKLDESIKYVGTINVDGEDSQFLGKRITYNFIKNPQSIISNNKLTVSVKSPVTYTGKQIKPAVTVKFNGETLTKGKDYTVSYGKNIAVGKGKVTIKSTGSRFSSVDKTFNIIPKGTSLSNLTAGKKSFTVKWKKQAVQTTGYQIQYSLKSNMASAKTVTIKNNKTVSKKIKGLKNKKKYYVRIRTYKTVSGTKYYSNWSGKKSIKTK